MKKLSFLFFVFYFLILVIGGTIFYLKYLHHYSSKKISPFQVETVNLRPFIYFSKANILSRFDPSRQDEASQIETFETQGEIGQVDLNRTKSQIAYEQKSTSGNWEIYQGDFNQSQKEKIASKDNPNLENFQNFSQPQYSPDRTKLAFLAEGSTLDTIFVQELSESRTIEKILNLEALKIADYSWSKNSQNFIYCSSNPPKGESKNACFQVTLEGGKITKLFEGEVKKVSSDRTEQIVYLSRSSPPHLYLFDMANQNQVQLDDISSPKTIVSFQINQAGDKIVYEIIAEQKSDVYIANIDGTNRLQLTTDGNSSQPIFADGQEEKIAFLKQKNGIYTINFDQIKEQKIINLYDSISALLLWR